MCMYFDRDFWHDIQLPFFHLILVLKLLETAQVPLSFLLNLA